MLPFLRAERTTIKNEELVFQQWIRSPRYFPIPPPLSLSLSLPSSRDRELVRITSTPVHLSLIDYNVKPVYLVAISCT